MSVSERIATERGEQVGKWLFFLLPTHLSPRVFIVRSVQAMWLDTTSVWNQNAMRTQEFTS
jgi:hypothetical protein